ncbi:MAG: hypothetical protein NZ606_07055 [Candidatus Kapabacteria bacterium]|nr:hypothetical protein [Candidatus Kapabacteria bacterium]
MAAYANSPKQFHHALRYAAAIVPWFWLGIIVGISVIETPVRFRTPPITRSGAAMLGVAVFHALAYVELVLFILLGIAAVALRNRFVIGAVAVLGIIVAAEHALVVPVLAVRAALLVQGTTLEPSSVHMWATMLEFSKMLALGAIGSRTLSRFCS